MSKPRKLPEPHEETPLGVLPPPELLELFSRFGPELPAQVLQMWAGAHQRAYRYAMLSLAIGGVLGLALIGGFVYLVMNNHGSWAGALLGTGAIGMVAAFLRARFR